MGRRQVAALLVLTASCSSGNPVAVNPVDASTDAAAARLEAEAGFFEVPAQPTAAKYRARLFYVFQPADTDASHRPLVVLFNGGPGYATTAGLLAYGTGRTTLDATADAGTLPVANGARWTSFANLLYIDARMAGFSYGLGNPSKATCTYSEVEDASDFVRALLDFLDTHAALTAAPVIIAAESYGGVRATWMLDLLLRYRTEGSKGGSDLPKRIQTHYDAAFADRDGGAVDEATAAKQFGAQVLIQPLVLGQAQYDGQRRLVPSDLYVGNFRPPDGGPPPGDWLDAQKPLGWTDGLDVRTEAALSDARASAQLLGRDLASISLLQPAARRNAFRVDSAISPLLAAENDANAALSRRFGTLASADFYFSVDGEACSSRWHPSDTMDPVFVDNLRYVRTFITDARYDPDIYAPAIPNAFQQNKFGGLVDYAPRAGVARPGWFEVQLPPDPRKGLPAKKVEVRFPLYDHSGHMVAVTQAEDLASDVRDWLHGR